MSGFKTLPDFAALAKRHGVEDVFGGCHVSGPNEQGNTVVRRVTMADIKAIVEDAVAEERKACKRKLLLDLWDALPLHAATGDLEGSLRATIMLSEVGDEIKARSNAPHEGHGMKIKTSELIGPALDWAVAKCEGASEWLLLVGYKVLTGKLNKYSTDWACGGPIMERLLEEGMLLERCDPAYKKLEKFKASMNGWKTTYLGNTPLIAAMRCYVASKLGDEIDVPDDLFSSYGSNELRRSQP